MFEFFVVEDFQKKRKIEGPLSSTPHVERPFQIFLANKPKPAQPTQPKMNKKGRFQFQENLPRTKIDK